MLQFFVKCLASTECHELLMHTMLFRKKSCFNVSYSWKTSSLYCVYAGKGSDHFSVIVYHGGFFCCHGKHRDYCSGASVWFDFCDRDNWTPAVIENLIEDLGYECEGRMRVY